jgi:hypothetical protein
MKKIITMAILSVLVVFFAVNHTFAEGIGGTVKLGIDLAGDHEVSGYGLSGSDDVETGFSLTGELFGKVSNIFDIGGGVTIQIPRSQEDFAGDFYFIPLYGMIRARIETETVTPYFIGQLGYNFFDGDSDYKGYGILEADLEGGLYYGLGAGIIIGKHFLIEALYSVNNGTGTILGYEFDIEYSKVTLNFGYNF